MKIFSALQVLTLLAAGTVEATPLAVKSPALAATSACEALAKALPALATDLTQNGGDCCGWNNLIHCHDDGNGQEIASM
jgi:hypothetical protein